MHNDGVNKKVLAIITIIAIPILTFFIYTKFFSPSATKFITANPLDLDQISAISQFRSCAGHDYSGYNEDLVLEEDRSMNHYISPKEEYLNSNSTIRIYSPFDGLITKVEEDKNGEGYQVWIEPRTSEGYNFVFFHINLTDDLKANSEVSSGQHIGYAELEEAENFDVALKKFVDDSDYQILESPFTHMSRTILKEYENKGVTIDNIIISKEDRDRLSCTFGVGSGEEEWVFLQ